MEVLNERWVPIFGYEGFYEVSDHGRVRSLPRFRRGRSGCLVPVPGKIMKLRTRKVKHRQCPYVDVLLRRGESRDVCGQHFLVHRLVAQAFVGELFEGAEVDHKDGAHGNNHWKNLRILTQREHGLLHPMIADKERNAQMQIAAQQKIRDLRAEGKIVGKLRVA